MTGLIQARIKDEKKASKLLEKLHISPIELNLKLQKFPIVHSTLPLKSLTLDHPKLLSLKRVSILKVSEMKHYLFYRKFSPSCNCPVSRTSNELINDNPVRLFSSRGFFNQVPGGCNYNLQFLGNEKKMKCPGCGIMYSFNDSESKYLPC
jgi:hypothetical protein